MENSHLFGLRFPQALILLLDFVVHASGTLCIANTILTVYSISILSAISLAPSLPVCVRHLVARGQLPVGVFDGLDVIATSIWLASALIVSV